MLRDNLGSRLIFSWSFNICGNLKNVKKKLGKLFFPVKWSTWLYTSTLQNFARQHFFDVGRVSIVVSWERGVETGEDKVLKKLEHKVVASLVAGKILRSTEIKFEVTESKLNLLLKHSIMHVEKHSCE